MENKIKKILIIRVGAIGDVVHTSALFRSIKKIDPQVEIHYLTSELIFPLLIDDKDLTKILTINPKFKLFSAYAKNFARKLRAENYDLVINLQPSLKFKGLIFFSGIKNKLTYKKTFKVHAVKNFWQTGLKAFPNMPEENELKLFLPKETINFAKEKVKNLKSPIVIINAGGVLSKRKGRTYPVDKWIELGNLIQKKYDGTIILNGAKEDKEILSSLNQIKNSINFIGELSLVNSCGIISQGDLMISGDSGPLHIASALGVKSIGLYGSMPSGRTGCYCNGINISSKKSCVPCNRRKCKYIKSKNQIYAPCMEEISVTEIMENVDKLLADTKIAKDVI